MIIIKESEVTLESIQELFNEKGILANVVEVAPAEPAWGLRRDAYLEVNSEDDKKVIIWTNSTGEPEAMLRMRSVLVGRKERRLIEPDKLNSWIAKMNQNAHCLGSFDGKNALGVTLEYKIPFNGGILAQTIFSAYEEFLKGVQLGKNLRILVRFLGKYDQAVDG